MSRLHFYNVIHDDKNIPNSSDAYLGKDGGSSNAKRTN